MTCQPSREACWWSRLFARLALLHWPSCLERSCQRLGRRLKNMQSVENRRSRVPPVPDGRRCLLLAGGALTDADRFAREHGLVPSAIIGKKDLPLSPAASRLLVRRHPADFAAAYSDDWARQPNPQLYALTLALLPFSERYLLDGATGSVHCLSRAEITGRVVSILPGICRGLVGTALEAAQMWKTHHRGTRRSALQSRRGKQPEVLAIWIGKRGTAGGSITHMSGILSGFREQGYRVGLVTLNKPPDQLRRAVDEVDLLPALPESARVTADISAILVNRALRRFAARFVRTRRPTFIYQRHTPFLYTGPVLANAVDAPFVLEWNASEIWTRMNWETPSAIARVFDPFLGAAERFVASTAQLVVAISDGAAEMAYSSGASPNAVAVVPNGVDVRDVDRSLDELVPSHHVDPNLIGWVGSFGVWHGAEMLVRALHKLPSNIRLLMIGEGSKRRECESLAESLGISKRIEWTGSLPHPEALRRLAACAVLASPHVPMTQRTFFGSPTKIFEYMALGRPIVASRLAQIGEILEDGRTARLVTPGDADELADGLADVLRSLDQATALGRAARAEAEARHTWGHRADAILQRLEGDRVLGR